ncbi:MAG: ABC transporter permease [Gammaproteobacteria bacterium]|nr:ABC transporter permease [Gammaproteobacteria bacterium]
MNLLLARASARTLLHHPWQLALALLGIAIGVGMVSAVQLTQQSARQAMRYAQTSLAGAATDRIEAVRGRLDETVYVELVRQFPPLALSPVLKGALPVAQPAGGFIELVGLDPLSLLEGEAGAANTLPDPGALIGSPNTALISGALAGQLGLGVGDTLTVKTTDGPQTLSLIGLLPPMPDGGKLVVVDIATAQELLGLPGKLSSIELRLPAADAARWRGQISALLPGAAHLSSIDARLAATEDLTRAFDINLTALSLLALLVGMFLIYNTEAFLILQRQRQFAQLRALGVSTRELLGLLLLEAAMLGGLGSGLGLVLGEGVARVLLKLVAQTINDLYYRTAITEVSHPPLMLGGVWLLGVIATLIAAAPPVLETTKASVRRGLRPRDDGAGQRRQYSLLARWGIAAAVLATMLLIWPSRSLIPGFLALFCVMLAGALWLPGVLSTLAGVAVSRVPLARWPALAMGLRLVARHGGRHGLAAAALMAASATAMAMTIMIGSFRVSVSDWLGTLLRADVYISALEPESASATLLERLRERLATVPGVVATSAVSRSRQAMTDGEAQVMAYDLPPAARAGFHILSGDAAALWQAWETADVVMVSEPWAWRHGTQPGAQIVLRGRAGPVVFRVAAVFKDYASERGSIAMSRSTFLKHFEPVPLDGIGLYRDPNMSLATLTGSLRAALADAPVRLHTREEVKTESMAVFDRTFAVTDVLRVVALGVAVIGIVSALLAQQFERLREYGVLRALGFSATEVALVVLSQTAILGLVAASGALPLAGLLAAVLIDVINLRSFGWSMALVVPWGALAHAWLLAMGAALLAGVYPAWCATRAAPAAVMRDE